jgi:nucleoid DNA-binding protein
MLSNYLKALIESNNRIIIPDFGAFMIQDSPEGKQISFNDFLKFNDGLLVNQIIKTDKVSKIQATDQIKEFITEVEKSFAQNKPYEISGLGLLSKDNHGNIKFETKIEQKKAVKPTSYDSKPTIVLDEEVKKPVEPKKEVPTEAKPIVKEEIKTVSPPIEKKPDIPVITSPKIEEKKQEYTGKPASTFTTETNVKLTDKKPMTTSTQNQNNTSRNVIIIIVAALIIAGGTYVFLKYGMGKKEAAVVEVIPVPEPIVDTVAMEVEEPIVVEEAPVDENVKKFYLIAGSFKVPSNAERFNKKLIGEGFESDVIVRKNGYHCVSLKTFYTWNDVVAEWRKMKDTNPGVWILIR